MYRKCEMRPSTIVLVAQQCLSTGTDFIILCIVHELRRRAASLNSCWLRFHRHRSEGDATTDDRCARKLQNQNQCWRTRVHDARDEFVA